MNAFRVIGVIVWAVLADLPSVAHALPPMEALNDSVKLGIGDRVSFRIIEEGREPITLFVTDSGEIEVPLAGRLKASGKTCKQLANEIKTLAEKEYFKKATVSIVLQRVAKQPPPGEPKIPDNNPK